MSADPRPHAAAAHEGTGAYGDYAGATIAELAAALSSGRITSERLTDACLARIVERDPSINAFILVMREEAIARARDADREIAAGRHRGPLHGVPISLKDIIDVRGTATTAASRVRMGHVASHDASLVVRLRDAGAVLIGKTNLHEFAVGTTSDESAFGAVHHPLDAGLSPGGSSGGSAASVLADMAYASIGTDTGGSVRIPAAACGLVGLKPALGEIALDGVVPLSTTLDHAGPLCRAVDDAEILYDVLTGAPPAATTAADAATTLGVLRGYFTSLLHPEVATVFDAACEQLASAGVTLESVEMSHAGDIGPVYLHILLGEAAAYHAKTLESRAADYTPNVRSRLELGRYVLAEDYVRALRGRDLLRKQVATALGERSALLLPTLAIPAPKLGSTTVRIGAAEEPVRNVMLRLTQLFNITGHPAITLPCGSTSLGLPVGLQLVGADTRRLLATAKAVERYLGPGTSRWGSGRSAGG
jgi:aspartyl-tRNA(Asn)/glutamyl-tRNA(Gln) amidotransferase subunit A